MALATGRKRQTLLEEVISPRVVSSPGPFLKWAGGKGQLLNQMAEYLPKSYGTYYEPFLGGGALFFRLLPKRAVLSDSNSELIGVFRAVRDDPGTLMSSMDRHTSKPVTAAYYYRIRRQDPSNLTPVERAARMVFLNKTCFNGLYRVNSKGEFNVPFGRYKNPKLYSRESVLNASLALKNAELACEDFRDALKHPQRNDFVYLDPPYQPLTKTAAFTDYTREGFGEKDQRDLAEAYKQLDRRGCLLMLSNSSTPLLRDLYREYSIVRLKAKRAINCKGTGRGAVDELLVTNY